MRYRPFRAQVIRPSLAPYFYTRCFYFSIRTSHSTAFLTSAAPDAGRRPVSIRPQTNPRIETEERP